MKMTRIPGALRHEMPLRRTGTHPENKWVPDQRRTTSCCTASGTEGL
jgi:hypothetical protein